MPIDISDPLARLGIDPAELQKRLDARQWFHSYDFGSARTKGNDPTEAKLAALGLPDSLAGKSVIDIGAYDGFFSFEAERRGAARVVANDHWCWTWPGLSARGNIDMLKELFGSKIEILEVPVEKLSPTTAGTFDVVLFLGVLYHAPDPIGYLRNVRSITREILILETLVDMLDVDRPAAAFYEVLNNDASNHWGPNALAVEAMLRKVGFSRVERKGMWHANTIAELSGQKLPPGAPLTSGRMVFHVYP